MKNNEHQDVILGTPKKQNWAEKAIAITKNKYIVMALAALTLASCKKDDPIEPVDVTNPVVTLSNVRVIDADGDGNINDVTGNYTATDNKAVVGKAVTVGNIDGTVSGNTFIVHEIPVGNATVKLTAHDAANNSGSAQKSISVAETDIDSTIGNPNPTVDENSTENIDPEIADPNGIASSDFVDSTSELAQMFNLVNHKLELKSGKTLNHEANPIITGQIKIIDNLGNVIIKDVSINLNDIQEPQTIDVFGDGGLLPNGEAYAIKTDEEEAGETLPVMYYNHGSARRTETDVNNSLPSSAYGDAQSDINNIYGTGIGPKHSSGQDMVGFDGTANEMVIYASDGSELARIDRIIYGRMMQKIKNRTGISTDINFSQDGTVLNAVWEDMIKLHTQYPSNLYLGCDRAIQNHLGV